MELTIKKICYENSFECGMFYKRRRIVYTLYVLMASTKYKRWVDNLFYMEILCVSGCRELVDFLIFGICFSFIRRFYSENQSNLWKKCKTFSNRMYESADQMQSQQKFHKLRKEERKL